MGRCVVKEWELGRRMVWSGLDVSSLLLLRSSELFANDRGTMYEVYILRKLQRNLCGCTYRKRGPDGSQYRE